MKIKQPKFLLPLIIVAAAGFTSLAWTGNQSKRSVQTYRDTTPTRQKSSPVTDKEYKKDFDKELDELDRARKELQNLPDIDFKKIQSEIDASMKQVQEEMSKHKIDMEKMQKELKESLSRIDLEKMQADIKASLKELDKVDMQKMKLEIEKAMEEIKTKINPDEIRKQVEESISKVDMEKVKKEMKKVKEEMEMNKDKMKIDLGKAREDVAKAKEELKSYQEMVYAMEKDGLLDTKNDYKIEYSGGDLYINGTKEPAEVTNKYKKYFRKDKVTIKKEKGEMNINIQ